MKQTLFFIILTIFATLICINKSIAQITFENSDNSEQPFSTKTIENLKAPDFNSFSEAANWADLVAVAQVDDIEYDQVRNLNAKGYAFLNILIPYKGAKKDEPIAVIATGFEDNVCYYPDRINEGERFLVFLKKAPDQESNVYYGFKPYCQMQILLSELGQYILRTPLETDLIQIDEKIIEKNKFNDPHSMIDTTLWTNIKRDEFMEKYKCIKIESSDNFNKYFHLRYTEGIPIYKIRPLLKLKYKPRISSRQL